MNEVCDTAVALNEEDGKDMTIFISPPVEDDDTDEDWAGKFWNCTLFHKYAWIWGRDSSEWSWQRYSQQKVKTKVKEII